MQNRSKRSAVIALTLSLSAPGACAQAGSSAPPSLGDTRDAVGHRIDVQRYAIELTPDQYLPYPGRVAITRQQFPRGFPRAIGSGIHLKAHGRGGIEFWVLGDRGPNGDGPEVAGRESKLFPAPQFAPAFGVLRLSGGRAVLSSVVDVSAPEGRKMSGLPVSSDPATPGEVALSDSLNLIGPDPNGIDPEAITHDGRSLWLSDEYGPFVMKIDPANGRMLEKLTPGAGLPAIFAKRRLNRGMEALSYDAETGRLWGALQSAIDDGAVTVGADSVLLRDFAPFIRWVEIDPVSRALRQFAYPIDAARYKKRETGRAKIGDIAALGGGRFAVIEEGTGADGQDFNLLVLVDVRDATDIHTLTAADLERSAILGRPVGTADWRRVTPLKKRLLADLNRLGWNFEKAEGLALVDERTLAITNDNDYGMTTRLVDAREKPLDGKVDHCRSSGHGAPLSGDHCPNGAYSVAAVRVPDASQAIWLIRFDRALRHY